MIKNTKLDKFESEIWNWGLDQGFSMEILSKTLLVARFSSLERFITAFFRENVNSINSIVISKTINNQEIIEIKLKMKGYRSLIIPIKKKFPLRRIYLSDLPYLVTNTDTTEIIYLPETFNVLKKVGVKFDGHWVNLKRDLLLSNAYLFMAILLREKAKTKYQESKLKGIYEGKLFSGDNLLTFLEQWTVNGHLLHPSPKSKLGFTFKDLEQFSPESQPEYSLYVGAIKKNKAYFLTSNEETFHKFLNNLSPKFSKLTVRSLKDLGLNPREYIVLPIHPWQYKNYLKRKIQKELKNEDFVLLPKLKIKAKPLIAFRTVYVSSLDLYFKLPLNIQITSALRTLSSKTCHNSIVLSQIFENLKNSNVLPNSFEFQKEIASIRLKENFSFHKNLSVIMREGCTKYVDKKDLLLPAATLFEDSPINNGCKIIDDILSLYLNSKYISNRETTAKLIKFFKSYVELLINPSLTLLTMYGIGVEAHLQNSIIVFRDHYPYKFIYRDHDAVSICAERLPQNLSKLEFYQRSWNISRKVDYAQDKLMHSLFHSHISELINYLDLKYGLDYRMLWELVSDKVFTFLEKAKKNPNYKKSATEDLKYFLNRETGVKSLLKMKLRKRTKRYIFTSVENPIHRTPNQFQKK